jgi:hypothetical protein
MPRAHPDLQTSRYPLAPGQRRFSATWSRALILGALLFATLTSPRAQDGGALPTGKPNSPYPGDAEITFQWNYSCPSNNARTFRCQGAGGSDHLTRLDIYLGTLPVNGDQQQRAPAIFYYFSSRGFPHGNGFAISTGINTLSCKVSGMTLDYSGAPKAVSFEKSRSQIILADDRMARFWYERTSNSAQPRRRAAFARLANHRSATTVLTRWMGRQFPRALHQYCCRSRCRSFRSSRRILRMFNRSRKSIC